MQLGERRGSARPLQMNKNTFNTITSVPLSRGGKVKKRTPRPAAGIRAAAQARGPAGGDRARVVADHRGGRAQADTLRGAADIGREVGAVIDRHSQALRRPHHRRRPLLAANDAGSAAEARLDGLYVIRTSVPAAAMTAEQAVGAYKGLARVERAFRSLKTVDLEVRPVYHWLAPGSGRMCCCVCWPTTSNGRCAPASSRCSTTMPTRRRPNPARHSFVAKAQRSEAAVTKQTTGRTEDGLPVHSFHSLLADLATLTRNTVVTALAPDHPFTLTTRPTTIQQKALDLLGVAVTRTQ